MDCAKKNGDYFKTFRDIGFDVQIDSENTYMPQGNLCIDSNFSGFYGPIDMKFGR